MNSPTPTLARSRSSIKTAIWWSDIQTRLEHFVPWTFSLRMPELKSLSPAILLHIAKILNVPMKGLIATIELLDEGGTVPFIARYRKEVTGNLDEVQIRSIEEKLAYFRE